MKTRFTALVMALAMIFSLSLSTTAFADDVSAEPSIEVLSDGNSAVKVVPIEEVGMSREEALSILGLSEEEAEGTKLYSVSVNPDKTLNNPGDYEIDPFVHLTNGGTAKGITVRVYGNKMRWGAGCVYVNASNSTCTATLLRPDVPNNNLGTLSFTQYDTKKTHGWVNIGGEITVQFEFYAPTGTNVAFGSVISVG